MKPIFEPGDFEGLLRRHAEMSPEVLAEAVCDRANGKLEALGIDAETPEKMKRLERNIEAIAQRLEFYKDQTELREKRLQELDRMIAEAPVIYGTEPYSVWDCVRARNDTHTARLVCIEPIDKNAEDAADIEAAKHALRDIKEHGTVPLSAVDFLKKRYGTTEERLERARLECERDEYRDAAQLGVDVLSDLVAGRIAGNEATFYKDQIRAVLAKWGEKCRE